jgi:uncharacterized protein (TIGR04255 family)
MKRYPKAPVSEVIFGVTFSEKRLSIRDLFDGQQALSDKYPRVEIRPPLVDEWMSGFQITQELNPDRTGAVLIRLRSDDDNWMCQIQVNKVYLNWIRPDHEPVGNYPGYTAVYRKFGDLLNALSLGFSEFTSDSVKYYDLTYHDRLEWQEYIDSLSDAYKIMRFRPPEIETPEGLNNSFSRYTYSYDSLGGYGIFAVNTATAATGKQVLQLESTLRGITPHQSSDAWFNAAHMVQYDHFSRIFTPEILEQWA